MKTLDHKVIIYDSNCKVCSSLREVVLKLTPIPESKIKALKDLSPEMSTHIDTEKFRNVMALIDLNGGETRYGADGIAYIFASQYRIADLLFRSSLFFNVFSFIYKTQAYNRYIIATPKSNFKCDCFPDRVVKYRIAYILFAWVFSFLMTALFGIAASSMAGNHSTKQVLFHSASIGGTVVAVQTLLAFIFQKEKVLDYLGHLGSVMVVASLTFVPAILLFAITGTVSNHFIVISALIAAAVMMYLHVHRIRYLELSQIWTAGWVTLCISALIFMNNNFHFNFEI